VRIPQPQGYANRKVTWVQAQPGAARPRHATAGLKRWVRLCHDAAVAATTGTTGTRLIVIRGNSGSGKSTIARRLRANYGRGCALVEQDYLRRVVLRERDTPGGLAIGLIEQTVRYALDGGFHAILEGILHRHKYAPMLERLITAHAGTTTVVYLDVSLEETFRRHGQRPQAADFTQDDMRGWYQHRDLLGAPGELVLDEDTSEDQAVDLIATAAGLPQEHRDA
jgi:predicted kinase